MSADRLSWLRRRISLHLCLTELMQGLLIMAGLLLLTAWLVPVQQVWLMLIFSVSYLLMFLLRLFFRHIWSYFLLLALSVFIPLTLPASLLPVLILIGGLVFIVLRSFVLRLMRPAETMPSLFFGQIPAFVLIFVLNLLAVHFQLTATSQILFYFMAVHLLLAIWRWHAGSLDNQMERFMAMPTQPAGRIRRYNQLLFAVYALIALLLLSISPLLGIHRIFPWLGRQILALLRLLFSLLNRSGDPEPEPSQAPVEPQPSQGLPEELLPPGEPPAWLVFLSDALYYLFIILVAVGLVALLIYWIFRIYRRFYSASQDQDIAESLIPRLREDLREQVRRTGRRILQPFGRDDEEKIRLAYARLVSYLIRRGLPWKTGYSPRQYAAAARRQRGLAMDELTGLYEKARYGHHLCDADDVRRMQLLCRQARRMVNGKQREEDDRS